MLKISSFIYIHYSFLVINEWKDECFVDLSVRNQSTTVLIDSVRDAFITADSHCLEKSSTLKSYASTPKI